MASRLRKHITLEDFKLNHNRPSDFVHSVLCDSPVLYAIAITCVTIHAVTMTIYSGFTSAYGIKIFIWLTYWSFFALTARFLVTTFNCWRFVFCRWTSMRRVQITQGSLEKQEEESIEMPRLYKVQWVLQNVSGCSALIVSALYWVIMYDPKNTESVRSINSHGLNMIFVLSDLLLSRAPVRIHHFFHTCILICLYIFFTIIYWAAGGLNHKGEPYIYSLLNYSEHPGRAVVVFLAVAFLATPLTQILIYGLFRLRQWLTPRLCGRDERREQAVKFQISTDDDPDVRGRNERRSSGVLVEDLAEDGSDSRQRNGHYSAVPSGAANGVRAPAANSDLDSNIEPNLEGGTVARAFRPPLATEVSQVSCTDSTKGLLD